MKAWITCDISYGDSYYEMHSEKPIYNNGDFKVAEDGKSAEIGYMAVQLLLGRDMKIGEVVEVEVSETAKFYWEQVNS